MDDDERETPGPSAARSHATLSGEVVPEVVTSADLDGWDPSVQLGEPGSPPFTRGVYPSMYRGRLWTMRQFAGFGSPEETNARYRFLLDQGQGGLSVAFDMPTLMGLDSDDARSEGEVGRCGVATDSIDDFEVLFGGIPLGDITTSMTISGPAVIAFAFFLATAERQGVAWERLDGTLQTDILKEYIAQKEWLFPPRPHLRLIGDLMAFCAERAEVPSDQRERLPHPRGGLDRRPGAGVHAGRRVRLRRARALARARPHSVRARSLVLLQQPHRPVRGAREVPGRTAHLGAVAARAHEVEDPDARRLRFHTQTAGVSNTAQQPMNNVVRTALEALAAVLGGTQSLHTNALDEVLALPTEDAARLALRTQQVIAHESGVADVTDPLGGAYAIEAATDRVEERAEELFAEIDAMGKGSMLEGVLAGIDSGWFQRLIAEAAFEEQRRYESGDLVKVGVNAFVDPNDRPIETLVIGPKAEARQRDAVARTRAQRDRAAADGALARLGAAAATDENLIEPLIACARARCTEGEIVSALTEVFGTYRETPHY